jgi:hypothetical protein
MIAWAVCLAPSNDEGARLRDKVNQYAKIAFNLKIGDKIDLGEGFISRIKDMSYDPGFDTTKCWFYNREGLYKYRLLEDIKKVKS